MPPLRVGRRRSRRPPFARSTPHDAQPISRKRNAKCAHTRWSTRWVKCATRRTRTALSLAYLVCNKCVMRRGGERGFSGERPSDIDRSGRGTFRRNVRVRYNASTLKFVLWLCTHTDVCTTPQIRKQKTPPPSPPCSSLLQQTAGFPLVSCRAAGMGESTALGARWGTPGSMPQTRECPWRDFLVSTPGGRQHAKLH